MTHSRLKSSIFFLTLAALLAAAFVFFTPDTFAQLRVPETNVPINQDIVTDKSFGEAITLMVNYFLGFLGFLAVLVFVYAGVLWVLNGGNEELITKAKKMMLYAAGGLIIIILSYTIVTFITASAGGGKQSFEGAECVYDFDCEEAGDWCIDGTCSDKVQELFANECLTSADCNGDSVCFNHSCVEEKEAKTLNVQCFYNTDCNYQAGQVCWNNICQQPPNAPSQPFECFSSSNCSAGEYCSVGICKSGNSLTCSANTDCQSPQICDDFGLCHNPNAGSGTSCSENADCNSGFVCDLDSNKCEYQSTGGLSSAVGQGVSGSPAIAASEQNIQKIDNGVIELDSALDGIAAQINQLPLEEKDQIKLILESGLAADKKAQLEELLATTEDPVVALVLEKLLSAFEQFISLREELDDLKEAMPESAKTIELWNETSEALDTLIDDADSSIKLRRFQTKYRDLKDEIRKFPVVQAKINALPAEGNVPFTVTFDGLDSVDPTGGTISDYEWSFLDNNGNEISLGNEPVVIYDFTEPNTYAVNLRVSTSKTDDNGYKTAVDGVSTVWVKAKPPASQVQFWVNGNEVNDVHHITIKEAQGGLVFDPSPTVPALGRVIEKYEWFFGDGVSELRTTPTTVIHSYSKAGEYFVKLVTTDNHGIKDQKVLKLIVKSLAADIEISPKQGNVNTQFSFKGVSSRSDDGAIKDYVWMIENSDGQGVAESAESSFFHQFDRPGEYKVFLSVTDITGAKDNAMEVLEVISRPPVASFTHSVPKSNHPNQIEFNAINSYDPDEGDQITYSWDFDGDGDFEIVDSNEAQVTHLYNKVGDHRVRLQIKDSFGEHDLIEKVVPVKSILSGDILLDLQAVHVGQEVTFEAASPLAEAYLWEFGDGETASTEEDAVTYVYNRKGKYTVKLHFFDKDDQENTATVTILVGDSDKPVSYADFLINGREQTIIQNLCGDNKDGALLTRADTLLLTGRHSINRDGSARLLAYDWDLSEGSSSSQKEFTHRFDEVNEPGECFTASLVVRDEISGQVSSPDTLYIKVINQLPELTDFVIEPPRDVTELATPVKVGLRGINPRDNDGAVKRYRWWYYREGEPTEKLGVHTTTLPSTEMIITALGQPGVMHRYFFVLEITDTDGGVYSSEERFSEVSFLDIKNGPNLSPVAEFTMDKTTISTGDSITFVSQSYDPQGDILKNDAYLWDFDGDGQFDDVATGAQVNRQYNTPGEYEVRLKVVHRGLSSSITKTVFVQPTQSLPQAAFMYDVSGNTVNFDASHSRFDPDLDDTTLRFEWDFDISQDANGNGINDDDVQSTEFDPTFTYEQVALYKVRLKVKDSLGMEGVVVRDVDLTLSEADREANTYRSLQIQSPNQPLTTLQLIASPITLSKGATADLEARVLNADNSPYFGAVYFEVVEGSGEFSPNPVYAKSSTASTVFSATDTGPVRIRIRATDTHYGELIEEVILNVVN